MNTSNTTTTLTIAAFGDSITAANEVAPELKWPALLEAALVQQLPERTVTVVNAGVGGNTSREGLARIDDVIAAQPNIVLVEFGGNDAGTGTERHVPLEEFARNLATIEAKFRDEANAQMVVVTFPPVVSAQNRGNEDAFNLIYPEEDKSIEPYRQFSRDYAAEYGLTLVDIDAALRRACERDGWMKYFLPDGVHLTEAGNQVIFQAVRDAISGMI